MMKFFDKIEQTETERSCRVGAPHTKLTATAKARSMLRCYKVRLALRLRIQRLQNRFLHVHAIFRLIENYRLRAVEHFRSDFTLAMRRKAVHEESVGRGESHQRGVHLIR